MSRFAHGRRFGRTGHHAHLARVGRELTEQPVTGAAAHDVQRVDGRFEERLQLAQRPPEVPGQAFQDGPYHLAPAFRYRKAVLPAIGHDALGHLSRLEEVGIVQVEVAPFGGRRTRFGFERFPRDRSFLAPRPEALLQHPEARQVFQETNRAVEPRLVREAGLPGGVGQDRCGALHAQQRPGAEADVSPAGARTGGHGRHRAGRVVRARSDHGHRWMPPHLADHLA